MDWPHDAKAEADLRTVFCRNLPYHWTDADLLTAFEEHGPVKRAFVVTEKKTRSAQDGKPAIQAGTSRGFGYIEFALIDDANRAIQQMNGKLVEGRRLNAKNCDKNSNKPAIKEKRPAAVESTPSAASTDSSSSSSTSSVKPQKQPIKQPVAPVLTHDSDSETSDDDDDEDDEPTVKSDVDADADVKDEQPVKPTPVTRVSETSQPPVRSVKHVPQAVDPSLDVSSNAVLVSGISPNIGSVQPMLTKLTLRPVLVLFPAPESTPKYKAARLVFNGEADTKQAIAKLNGFVPPMSDPKQPSNPLRCIPLPVISSRLIIRNLPYHITLKHIRSLFEPFGTIVDVTLPSSHNSTLNRGFAFVHFPSLVEANKALNGLNGSKQWGRPIAVDWSLGKGDYAARKEMAQKVEERAEKRQLKKAEVSAVKDEEKEDSMMDESMDQAIKTEDEDEDDVSVKAEDGDDSDSSMDDYMGESMSDDDESVNGDDIQDISDTESTVSAKETKHPMLDEGAVLFIRNLSYETTEAALFAKFKSFGAVRYARIVMEQAPEGSVSRNKANEPEFEDEEEEDDDRPKKRSKGVAFVCYYKKEDAQRVLDLASSGAQPEKNNADGSKKRDANSKTRITALSENGISLDGRQLIITAAVNRNAAQSFRSDSDVKRDKRNLYLAREGVILATSDAASTLTEDELKKREKYLREKKKKLENPNFCVSRVRLSVRSLPMDLDEKSMKNIFMKAVKLARRESKQKDDEAFQPIVVKQVKIARDSERPGQNGLGRSKRYGFIEFSCHQHALQALRHTNNNPAVWREFGGGRPIVEFAIDDARKLKVREQKQNRLVKLRQMKVEHDAKKARELEETAAAEQRKLTQKEQKKQARLTGTCYKCGSDGHQAKRCKRKKIEEFTAATAAQAKSNATAQDQPNTTSPAPPARTKRARPEPEVETEPIQEPTEIIKPPTQKKAKIAKLPKKAPTGRALAEAEEAAQEDRFDRLVNEYRTKFLDDFESEPIKTKWFNL